MAWAFRPGTLVVTGEATRQWRPDAMRPRPLLLYLQVTLIYRLASYNIACCYSQINQLDAGLDALKTAMLAGFDDYKMVRSDPSLTFLRESDQFEKLMSKARERSGGEWVASRVLCVGSAGSATVGWETPALTSVFPWVVCVLQFDEPLIDERTVKAFKKLFGFGKK